MVTASKREYLREICGLLPDESEVSDSVIDSAATYAGALVNGVYNDNLDIPTAVEIVRIARGQGVRPMAMTLREKELRQRRANPLPATQANPYQYYQEITPPAVVDSHTISATGDGFDLPLIQKVNSTGPLHQGIPPFEAKFQGFLNFRNTGAAAEFKFQLRFTHHFSEVSEGPAVDRVDTRQFTFVVTGFGSIPLSNFDSITALSDSVEANFVVPVSAVIRITCTELGNTARAARSINRIAYDGAKVTFYQFRKNFPGAGPKGDKGDKGDRGADGRDGATGPPGPSGGENGDDGWSPVLSAQTDGNRRVFRITDWVGGEGDKPGTGQYIGGSGLVSTASQAIDVRGPTGAQGIQGEQGPAGPAGNTINPYTTNPQTIDVQLSNPGNSADYARGNHIHGFGASAAWATNAELQETGGGAGQSPGTSTKIARGDHQHGLMKPQWTQIWGDANWSQQTTKQAYNLNIKSGSTRYTWAEFDWLVFFCDNGGGNEAFPAYIDAAIFETEFTGATNKTRFLFDMPGANGNNWLTLWRTGASQFTIDGAAATGIRRIYGIKF